MNNFNFNRSIEDEPQYREFNQVPIEQIQSMPFTYHEISYRSVSAMASHGGDYFASEYAVSLNPKAIEKPVLSKGSDKGSRESSQRFTFAVTSSSGSVTQRDSFTKQLKAQPLPDLLMPSHFDVKGVSLETLYYQIDAFLKETDGLACQFDEKLCEWTIVSLNGSNHTKFQLFIYESSLPSEFIVEGNRLMGDGFSFRSVFDQIKSLLCTINTNNRDTYLDSFSTSAPNPIPVPDENTDLLLTNESLEAILRMAKDSKIDAQLEASRILCDLTLDNSLQQSLIDHGCLSILKELILTSVSEWAQQHAMIALANLSDAKIFQAAIIKEGFLPILLKYSTDGPYFTAEMRRNAVHALANLCDEFSTDMLRCLKTKMAESWMNNVDNLNDERIKVHATRAREGFSRMLVHAT